MEIKRGATKKGYCMLNTILERKNDDKLIIRKEVPMRTISTSSFENRNNITLSGDFSNIRGEEREFYIDEPILNVNQELIRSIRENQVENAKKDLEKLPNNPFLLNNLGMEYLNKGDFNSAIEVFNKAITIKRDFKHAFLNLAASYTMKDDDTSAMSIYTNLLKENPRDTRVLINMGNICLKQKKVKEAEGIFTTVVKLEPFNITARNILAVINIITGNFKNAIVELRECIRWNTNLPAIYNNLGIAYGVSGSYDKAIKAFKITLKLSPNYVSAIKNLVTAFKCKNDILSAIEILEHYLAASENADAREILADSYFENGEYRKALRNLKIVSSTKTSKNEQGRLYNNMGVLYHKMNDTKNAEQEYLNSIDQIGYESPILLENIIELYFDLHKLDKVKFYIDILHNKFGEKGNYFYHAARYCYLAKEIAKASEFANRFIKINKKFAPAYSLLSTIYTENAQEYQKAIELNKEALSYLPNDFIVINNLAYSYLMNDDIENAQCVLDKAKNITNSVFLTATRGLLKIKEGNVEDGTKLYNSAAALARRINNERLFKQVEQKKHLELAKYYLKLKNYDSAKKDLMKVLSIKIDDSDYTTQAKVLCDKLSLS